MASSLRNKSQSERGIELSGSACVICGWAKTNVKGKPLVEGAHVRKFGNVADYDKFDNIIALCPNHHTEFDCGNFCIDFDKRVCCHANPADELNGKKLAGRISHVRRGYFEHHRIHVFKGGVKTHVAMCK
jgi:predicted restriction endonuclease